MKPESVQERKRRLAWLKADRAAQGLPADITDTEQIDAMLAQLSIWLIAEEQPEPAERVGS